MTGGWEENEPYFRLDGLQQILSFNLRFIVSNTLRNIYMCMPWPLRSLIASRKRARLFTCLRQPEALAPRLTSDKLLTLSIFFRTSQTISSFYAKQISDHGKPLSALYPITQCIRFSRAASLSRTSTNHLTRPCELHQPARTATHTAILPHSPSVRLRPPEFMILCALASDLPCTPHQHRPPQPLPLSHSTAPIRLNPALHSGQLRRMP